MRTDVPSPLGAKANTEMGDVVAATLNSPSALWRLTRVVGAAVLVSALALLVIFRQAHPNIGGLAPGAPLPPIAAEGWIHGPPPTMDELRGRVVVIDAWATWCGPCRREAPRLAKLHARYRDRGVVFLGLTDEGAESLPAIEAFLRGTGVTWPNGYGAGETLARFQHEGIPAVWVVGRDGTIVWNFDSSGEIEDGIEKALAGPSAP